MFLDSIAIRLSSFPRGTTAIALVAVIAASSPIRADDPPAAKDSLERLSGAVAAEPGLSPELKSAFEEAITDLRGVKAAQGKTTDLTKALSGLKISGDFRFRHESEFQLNNAKDRHRERVRFRIGAAYEVVKNVVVNGRLSTGSREDPRSPHQSFGEEFDKFEIHLDRISLTYQPADCVPGLTLTVGKIAHPFVTQTIYQELVIDADVSPTGVASIFELTKLTDAPKWLGSARLAAGGYVVSEYQAGDDAYAGVFQAALELKPADAWSIHSTAGFYYYSDLTPDGAAVGIAENAGNVVIDTDNDGTADDFASDFSIFNPTLALTTTSLPVPLTLSAEFIHNLRANGRSGANGYALGAGVGKSQKAGDIRVYYQWQQIERDAVLTLFSQDDFRRTVDFRGHVFGATYVIADPVTFHAWMLVSRIDDPAAGQSSDYEWKFRFDINVRI
jgi:hypothetical protein